MPRKDIIHDAVKNSLIRDGWTITADPYLLEYGEEDLFVDLSVLEVVDPQRKLYLAVSKTVYDDLETMETFRLVVRRFQVAMVVIGLHAEEVIAWIG